MGKNKRKRRRSVLKSRKHEVSSLLESLVVDTKPKHRTDLVEHICDVAIDLLGAVYGVDTSNAMIITPEDSTALLILAIARHSEMTGLDHAAVVEKLITDLARETASSIN